MSNARENDFQNIQVCSLGCEIIAQGWVYIVTVGWANVAVSFFNESNE